jgi:hypothetical protein
MGWVVSANTAYTNTHPIHACFTSVRHYNISSTQQGQLSAKPAISFTERHYGAYVADMEAYAWLYVALAYTLRYSVNEPTTEAE